MKRLVKCLLCGVMALAMTGCQASGSVDAKREVKNGYTPISGLDTDAKVSLTIAIPYKTNKALNTVANDFMKMYPNVDISLQYVEDYDTNAVQMFKDNTLDMILQKDLSYEDETVSNEETEEEVPTGKTTDDYFYNFAADDEIDFSDTTPDISDNYLHTRTDESGKEITYQYSYPLGGETRGVFVNKTLLESYGLAIPTNYDEFLSCCKKLKEEGLIAVQGGGDTAAYGLGLAPAANPVVHDKEALAKMEAANPGVSARFKDTLSKIYTIAVNRYFDYKTVEESGWFLDTSELGQAESFLGLKTDETTFEVIKPENNIGYVAFLPYISSTKTVIDALVAENDLDSEIVFIGSPLNEEGSDSPLYITPYYGICANKNSENLIWIREFVNFLFDEENNRTYAEAASIIPNVKDALEYVADKYGVDVEKDVTLCGQIRFSDEYNGYTPLASTLKDAMKCSAQKYMVNLNKDAQGNIQYEKDEEGKEFLYMGNGETKVYREYVGEADSVKQGYAFCTLDYYLDLLEDSFAEYRVE